MDIDSYIETSRNHLAAESFDNILASKFKLTKESIPSVLATDALKGEKTYPVAV